MTVNLRMLRRINQGEEVEAPDGAVGGDRRGGLIVRHGGSFKARPLALQQSLPQRGGGAELAGLGAEFHAQLLPQQLHAIRWEFRIAGDDRQVVSQGLGDDQAVKGIVVMKGQSTMLLEMGNQNR